MVGRGLSADLSGATLLSSLSSCAAGCHPHPQLLSADQMSEKKKKTLPVLNYLTASCISAFPAPPPLSPPFQPTVPPPDGDTAASCASPSPCAPKSLWSQSKTIETPRLNSKIIPRTGWPDFCLELQLLSQVLGSQESALWGCSGWEETKSKYFVTVFRLVSQVNFT